MDQKQGEEERKKTSLSEQISAPNKLKLVKSESPVLSSGIQKSTKVYKTPVKKQNNSEVQPGSLGQPQGQVVTSHRVPTDSLCIDDKQDSSQDKEGDTSRHSKTPSGNEPKDDVKSNDTLEDDYSVCQERMEVQSRIKSAILLSLEL